VQKNCKLCRKKSDKIVIFIFRFSLLLRKNVIQFKAINRNACCRLSAFLLNFWALFIRRQASDSTEIPQFWRLATWHGTNTQSTWGPDPLTAIFGHKTMPRHSRTQIDVKLSVLREKIILRSVQLGSHMRYMHWGNGF